MIYEKHLADYSHDIEDLQRRRAEMIVETTPMGLFNAIDYPADKVLYLSGGVGITPVMSMARWIRAISFCSFSASSRRPPSS